MGVCGFGTAGGAGFAGNAGGLGVSSEGFGICGATGVRWLAGGSCAPHNGLAHAIAIAQAALANLRMSVGRAGGGSVRDTKVATAEGPVGAREAQDMPAGALYVVATPLGNLDDLTRRARDTLARADRILAEDTRVTATLLAHYGITVRMTPFHAHNEAARVAEVVAALASGARIALVTDAGTPAISDPGARLVRAVHEAGQRVVPIPGASAVAAAVSAAGLMADRFMFVGFLPVQAKQRDALLSTLRALPAALVFYEAPHRVRATVALLAGTLGGGRAIIVARELTKKFEEIARMPLAECTAWLERDANHVRGEFVLIVDAPAQAEADQALTPEVERLLLALLDDLPPSAAARIAATFSGVPRAQVYARATQLKGRAQ